MTKADAIATMRAIKARIDALATAPACIELECELDALWADYDAAAVRVQAAEFAALGI